ncbi:drug/metabolite transporter (DMT)-like permease [Silvibacterium bohemicum]|uniref:Drug/metabolite transporter (DMT)-like permease n=1 Tax=Silvibacterium bohemicum TaxID=1577686 RepID=A0A841K7E9_9BACT|nr:GRP family sugar transporter [Silvibacterium bohemicum]MBB6146194.1 drug/metabolite transporter (DMT)-like permease [Silvibacterium bohemicum]
MPEQKSRSMHGLGVACGIAAGAWLGSAEAPTKLVDAGYSPIVISLCMVAGVFTARWTLPTLMKGTRYVFADLLTKSHLIVWGILAGALWAVANTLTVFAIKNVGLSIAFPLWNTNSLVGLLWGCLLFRELRGAGAVTWIKVVGGGIAVVAATITLGLASVHPSTGSSAHGAAGVAAALGASLLWGTMYLPYRKAYLSGMNPLSFVTVFTMGELGTMAVLAATIHVEGASIATQLHLLRPEVFWLFLGGFCWVIGDMFQQYATKYIGIGRGIPLSNTNQLWGLAWGALVFGELREVSDHNRVVIVASSLLMIAGAIAIGSAAAARKEHLSVNEAIARECDRYGLDYNQAVAAQAGIGHEVGADKKAWWDWLIVAIGVGVFAWLAIGAHRPPLEMNGRWIVILMIAVLALLGSSGWLLWKRTRFS